MDKSLTVQAKDCYDPADYVMVHKDRYERFSIAALRARVEVLEAAITDHNTGCELSCGRSNEYNAKAFGCEAYLSRGMQCPNCPMDDLIEIGSAPSATDEHGR